MNFEENVILKSFTSIQLGGRTRFFCRCASKEEIKGAFLYAGKEQIPVQILGAGSNTIFADTGFNGLVLRIELKGMQVSNDGEFTLVEAGAGEQWDEFVSYCIKNDLAGVECLSGIPGMVGATPIQNVGAYGQDVGESIESVHIMNRLTFEEQIISGSECAFEYRQSRFKKNDKDRFVILSVRFRLRKHGSPTLRYAELQKYFEAHSNAKPSLLEVRNAVLELRKKKSMILDPADPFTRSVGSFFLNPVISAVQFDELLKDWTQKGNGSEIPIFKLKNGVKISAAWLVEKSGFHRGYKQNGVGVSDHHSLALVNYDGSTSALLDLAHDIQEKVFSLFGIHLEIEPIIVPDYY